MTESGLWGVMRDRLRGGGRRLTRIESTVGEGLPDVNYCINGEEGWVELKVVKLWPKRPLTPLRVPHYSPVQRLWHREQKLAGGRIFVLLRVDETAEFFLFDGGWAAEGLGLVPRHKMLENALVYSRSTFPTEALLKHFTFPL